MNHLSVDQILAVLESRGFSNSDEEPLQYAEQWSHAQFRELVNVKKDVKKCPLVIHPRHQAIQAWLEAIPGVVIGTRPFRKSSQFKGFPREDNQRATPSFFGIDYGFKSLESLSCFLAVLLGQETSELEDDLDEIRRSASDKTAAKRLVEARLGQGKYRSDLIAIWGSCSITGCANGALLRASHIKPWRSSTDDERLDPHNGLLLVASLDAAFDRGLISFSSDGEVLVGSNLCSGDALAIGLRAGMSLRKPLSEQAKAYLLHHRQTHGFA